VPNPNQANRDGDKWGDACDLSGCHPACATGCLRLSDPTACTTPFYAGKTRPCDRCIASWHPKGRRGGCVPGAPEALRCPGVTGTCASGLYVGAYIFNFKFNVDSGSELNLKCY
jgi:hypothetical protein